MRPQPPSRLQVSFQALKSFVSPSSTTAPTPKSSAGIPTAFKNLQRLIHPPLPLTPRESEKLLLEITGSFRRQLAASSTLPTPSTVPESWHQSSPVNAYKQRQVSQQDRRTQSEYNASKLDRLLDARLEGNQPKSTISVTKSKEALNQRLLSHPLDVFEDHVWAGTATSQLTATCLRIYVNQLLAALKGPQVSKEGRPEPVPKPDGALVVIHLLRVSHLIPRSGPPLQDRNLTNWLTAGLLLSSKPSYPLGWVNQCMNEGNHSQAGEILWAIIQSYTKIYDEKSAVDLFLYIIGHTQAIQHTRTSHRFTQNSLEMFRTMSMSRKGGQATNILNKIARKMYEQTSSESIQKSIVDAINVWNPGEPGLTSYLKLKHYRDPYPGLDYLLDPIHSSSNWRKNNPEEHKMLGFQIAQEFYRKEQPFLAETVLKIVQQGGSGAEVPKTRFDSVREMKAELETLINELAKTVRMQHIWSSEREDESDRENSLQF